VWSTFEAVWSEFDALREQLVTGALSAEGFRGILTAHKAKFLAVPELDTYLLALGVA
jgi:hypothetical protein